MLAYIIAKLANALRLSSTGIGVTVKKFGTADWVASEVDREIRNHI